MIWEDFLKFDSTSDLHKELTNIVLIATEESNCNYCFCISDRKCALCDLCSYLFHDNNHIDGLPPRKFLQKNYDNREKLEYFVDKIWPFFEKMHLLDKWSLDFFDKEYVWTMRNYREGTFSRLTLTEIIDDDKIFVKNNPQLFDKEFYKKKH